MNLTELSPNELLRGKDQPSTKSASMEPGDRVGTNYHRTSFSAGRTNHPQKALLWNLGIVLVGKQSEKLSHVGEGREHQVPDHMSQLTALQQHTNHMHKHHTSIHRSPSTC
eukprot:TRINITY_DN476_c0_g2_i11.p2 TRINITY_DN476_c0_g2~~TRINITY_DN476_c0_g2_i11.p2  ORF type:complete len:111 (+),score=1.90 TRINITY_DN476_c0_g2_i11:773-1105(+)